MKKFYIRIFVTYVLSVVVFMTGFTILRRGFEEGLKSGIAIENIGLIVMVGVIGTLFYGLSRIDNIKRTIGVEKVDDKMLEVFQKEIIQVEIATKKVLELCQKALNTLKYTNKVEVQEQNGNIIVKTKTWKNTITIIISKIDHSRTEVEIKSRPRNRLAMVGNGSNYIDVKAIKECLQRTNI